MDYLFDKEITGIQTGYELSCCYIVDSHLRYVSLTDAELYYLHYVDAYKVGQDIADSENEYEFDVYVLSQNKPIQSMKSTFENLENRIIRVVHLKTTTGNPLSKKPKRATEDNIITRYSNKNNKLF